LFNLGAPDGPRAVAPFLFNLFNDPAIIRAPRPLRWLLAKFIAARRAPVARRIYRELGGASPLLTLTRAQAGALEAALAGDGDLRVFIAMRYWHPFSAETAAAVKAYGAERVVLCPLYPQYSTTTTGSSLSDWRRAAARTGLIAEERVIGCYPTAAGLIAAQARLIRAALDEAEGFGPARVLFSAHGLPKKIIARGDPYQWQVERTAAAVVDALAIDGLDWVVCYQSRVGRLEWIGPGTEAEIRRAGRDRVAVVVVPIAFVSEHSETLVELDIEYSELATAAGVAAYVRVPALGTEPAFIDQLADLVRAAMAGETPARGQCPAEFGACGCRQEEQRHG
jgi:ferrochelatase